LPGPLPPGPSPASDSISEGPWPQCEETPRTSIAFESAPLLHDRRPHSRLLDEFHVVGHLPALLGDDAGPNAVELVLAALAFCYSVGFVYNAAAKGYEIEELTYEVEGDLDLRNFVGIADGPRPGFTAIRVQGTCKARNATAQELEDLCQYVQDTSPVRDIIANAVPVTTSLTVL
jgi:uncharacterized OsmC-like protein